MKRKNKNIPREEYLKILIRLQYIQLEEIEVKKCLIPFLNIESINYATPISVFILELNHLNRLIDEQINFEKKLLIASIPVPICSYQEISENIDNLLNSYLLPIKDKEQSNIYLTNNNSYAISNASLNNFLYTIAPLMDKKRAIHYWLQWLEIVQLEKYALLDKKKLYRAQYKKNTNVKRVRRKGKYL